MFTGGLLTGSGSAGGFERTLVAGQGAIFAEPGTTGNGTDLFPGDCLPFNSTAKHSPIDVTCGPDGRTNSAGTKLQNETKNNLCGQGDPVQISLATLEDLHHQVVNQRRFQFGSDPLLNRNSDRSALADFQTTDSNQNTVHLGERKLVTLTAFVLEAKHDDVPQLGFSGESVNCKDLTLAGNDIHIALVESSDQVTAWQSGTRARKSQIECTSVTAEIIPHFRPELWNRFDSNETTGPLVGGFPVGGIKVRITGQLFFDASHDPAGCRPPLRRSSWEIHPVYKIEVDNGSGFESFDKWTQEQPEPAPAAALAPGSRNRNRNASTHRRRRAGQ